MTNLVRAEWVKFASLRASWTRLAIAFALNGLFVGVALWAFNRATGDTVPDTSIAARVGTLGGGITLASLVFIVVGIAIYTNEIQSRSIIPTITAAPDRKNLIAAKALVTSLIGLAAAAVIMIITSVVVFVVLDLRDFPLALDDEDVGRVIIGAVAYLAIAALFGLGVGILTNSSTGARAVGLLWPVAVESALKGFLPDWIDRILPFEAGSALLQTAGEHELPAAEGGGVFLAWSAGLVIAGWALFNRRDLSNS